MAKCLIVHGASGHGKVVADAARAQGWELLGFSDDDPSKRGASLLGFPVIATGPDELRELSRSTGAAVVLAIGSNVARRDAFERLSSLGLELATIVHPRAVVAESVRLGAGTVVFAGVVVNPDSIVGRNTILNTGVTVDHDNYLGDHVHVSPGAHLGGTVRIGDGTHVGIGASVRNNLTVGCWSVLGAGAVVVDDVPDRVVTVGVPASVVREHVV